MASAKKILAKSNNFQRSILLASLLVATGAHAVTLGTYDGTTVTYGGYVKLDALFSSYDDGSLPSGSLGRDFYVPSLTPIGGAEANTTFDMHARQTRFN